MDLSGQRRVPQCAAKLGQKMLNVGHRVVAVECDAKASGVRHDVDVLGSEMPMDLLGAGVAERQDARKLRLTTWAQELDRQGC